MERSRMLVVSLKGGKTRILISLTMFRKKTPPFFAVSF